MKKRTSERPVAGFNLVAVVAGEGLCLHYDGTLRPVRFGRGAHVVSSNRDFDEPSLPEREVLERWLGSLEGAPDMASLTAFLSSHEGTRPVCKHGDAFGTVSSSLYFHTNEGVRFLHAEGPPCRTAFQDFSSLLPARPAVQ